MSRALYRALSHVARGTYHLECLPFLYCTSTILSPYTSSKGIGAIHLPHVSIPRCQARRQHSIYNRSKNDIPFEGIQDYDLENTEQPDSTLTKQEKLAFEHLRQRQQIEDDEDADNEDGEALANPYDNLYTLFDSVIKEQEKRKTKSHDIIERNILRFEGKEYSRAPTLVETLSDLGDYDTARLKVRDGKIVREREQSHDATETTRACEKHLQRTRERLNNATTDVEIWNILDQELFSIVRAFNDRLRQEQKKMAPKLSKKASNKEVSSSRKDEFVNQLEVSSAAGNSSPTSSGHMELTTNAMLAIIQENYAQLNLMALRLWRRRFAMTPYSLQLLPHIKSLGNISYVLGASTGMYNEILFVKWTQYHDLHGIADLILEMVNQGLGANQLTLQLLSSIGRTRTKDLAGHRGKVLRSWWILRGIKEAWIRLRAIYKQLEQEVGKPIGMSDSRLQGALDVQHYGEVVGEDRIPGT